MRSIVLAVMLAVLVSGLSACQIVYKLPTRQGNVVDQKDLDKLQTGMTRDQIRFLLGTPIAKSPFRDDRWDYVGYYRSPRGELYTRAVSLFFTEDKLVRMVGVQEESGDQGVSNPDLDTLARERKKALNEDERDQSNQETGVVLTPEGS